MAKVIEFYEQEDRKPNRESVPEGQLAEVIMFPDTRSKETCLGRGGTFCAPAPLRLMNWHESSSGSWAPLGVEESNEFE